jgi:hypothetical protein
MFHQFLLGQWMLRSSRNVSYPVSKTQIMQNMGNMLILGASKYIQLDPFATQIESQIADVNIHTSSVFTSQGSQRAGVVRQHSNAQFRVLLISGGCQTAACRRLFTPV